MIACIVISTVTCLAEKMKLRVPFESDYTVIVQFRSTSLIKPRIKTVQLGVVIFLVKNAFLIYITIISPNLLSQVQTLAAMGVVLIDKFE